MTRLLFLQNFIFERVASEERRLPVWAKYILPLLLFGMIRIATASVLEYRGVDDPDSAGYVATANYIEEHGHIPGEHNQSYRQFPGLSMLMVVVNVVVRNMTVSGYVVVMASAMLAIVLMQYLFDDFRLTVIFVFFFPWWITTTSEILSEGPIDLCFLLCLWAMRDARPWSTLYLLGLAAGGFGVIIRQTAVFLLLPFAITYAYRQGKNNWRWAAGAAVVAILPLLAYLTWNYLAIGKLFPQTALQHEFMLMQVNQTPNPEHYSQKMLDVPGKGLYEGLTDPHQPLGKKAMVVTALALTLLALGRLIVLSRQSWDAPVGIMASAFAVALLTYLGFHLCIGGISGFRFLDRYLSELIVIIDWALFYRKPLRWPWIGLLCLFFLIFACLSDHGTHRLGFIK